VRGEHIETDLQPFDIKLASTLAWKNRDALIKAKTNSRANKDLLLAVDNNEALIALQNLLAHLTNETRAVLGLVPTDGPDEVEQKVQLALQKQNDAIDLKAKEEIALLQGKKVAVLGGKDLTPSNDVLKKPYDSKITTAKLTRLFEEEQFDESLSTLDTVLKKKNLHLSDQAIKGLLLLLSHNYDITKEDKLEECGNQIADVLMKNFYTAFGNSDNKDDAFSFVENTVTPHKDAMSLTQKGIMNTYSVHLYNVAKKLFAERLVKGQEFKAATFFKEVEEREFTLAMKNMLPKVLGLSEPKIDQYVSATLTLTTYNQLEREAITKQAKRILIARTLDNAPKLPLEEVVHSAVNEAIQQTVDAPHRIVVQRTQKKQTIVDETTFDFDHIVRRSSTALQKLMFTKILGMDERSITVQNHMNCFSSLEDVSAISLLSGLVSLVDDLKDDSFGTSQVSESARQKTKRALIKRFAKIEEKLLADSIVHDALDKNTIELKADFKNTLSSRLGSQDSNVQQKALANMDDHALQTLYNALVADPEDQVAFVDSQLIAQRILRIITAAHTGKHTNAIDYTFHDFMDYLMRATDDESVDIALSDTKNLVTKETLLQ
ncbi:MAG: hypothetical protein K2X53_03400, partial [Alphaproteobacteria bacterium]|nr:hypothetical protein [Alphaproteobacteria bacterium]